MHRCLLPAFLFALLLTPPAAAEIATEEIAYRQGDVTLRGFLAWDADREGQRPAVLVVHEWWGLNDYARQRARKLAGLGYIAFALDMYGEGKVTEHPSEAGEWAGKIRANVDTWRSRALAGLKILQSHPLADSERTAAIGYCFGGSTVLQLAYANAPVRGVVSFHGALPPLSEETKQVKPAVLVCHGAADGFISQESIQAFQAGMERVEADWHMITYGNARHSFTNPDADQRGIDGLRYNKKADHRSWQHMQLFFDEILAE
jgi:dienelactone hydrolase